MEDKKVEIEIEKLDEHLEYLAQLDEDLLIEYIKVLESRILRSIGYIESEMIIFNGSDYLLKILRGEDNE